MIRTTWALDSLWRIVFFLNFKTHKTNVFSLWFKHRICFFLLTLYLRRFREDSRWAKPNERERDVSVCRTRWTLPNVPKAVSTEPRFWESLIVKDLLFPVVYNRLYIFDFKLPFSLVKLCKQPKTTETKTRSCSLALSGLSWVHDVYKSMRFLIPHELSKAKRPLSVFFFVIVIELTRETWTRRRKCTIVVA